MTGSRRPLRTRLARLWRHFWISPRALERAFPPAVLARIQAATAAAEQGHSGEIRFAVESALPWSYLWRDAPTRERALMVFAKLRVWDTEHNNGVLLYVELADHGIEIVADRGIAGHVDATTWRRICVEMAAAYRRGDFEGGTTRAIAEIGDLLRAHFPVDARGSPNELPDQPATL